jgi:hypothetical protein
LLPETGDPVENFHGGIWQDTFLKFKYALYTLYETKNREFIESDFPCVPPECRLLQAHILLGTECYTKVGLVCYLSACILLSSGTTFAILKFQFDGQIISFPDVLTFYVGIGLLSNLIASIVRIFEIRLFDDKDRLGTFVLVYPIVAIFPGLIWGLTLGTPFYFIFQDCKIPEAFAFAIISALGCGLTLFFRTREKRLQIDQDLVKAGKSPKAGWIIDSIVQEHEINGVDSFKKIVERIRQLKSTKARSSEEIARGLDAIFEKQVNQDTGYENVCGNPEVPESADDFIQFEIRTAEALEREQEVDYIETT